MCEELLEFQGTIAAGEMTKDYICAESGRGSGGCGGGAEGV